MKRLCRILQSSACILFAGFLMTSLLAGCHIYHHPAEKVLQEERDCRTDEPPCMKLEVPQGDPACLNGGLKCAVPNALCSPPLGGKCKDRVTGGTCYCDCAR